MSQDHNLETEGRWEFKEVKAFVQGHKVRGGIGIVLATLRKQKTKTKPNQTRKTPLTKQNSSRYLSSEVRSVKTPAP